MNKQTARRMGEEAVAAILGMPVRRRANDPQVWEPQC